MPDNGEEILCCLHISKKEKKILKITQATTVLNWPVVQWNCGRE